MARGKYGVGGGIITTEYLYDREIGHILALLTPPNRLVMRLMLHTGMRVGDAVALRTEDLRLSGWYTEGKTGKRRRLGIPADLLAAIRAQAGPEWAFPGREPWRHRTRQAVWADVHRAAKALRMDRVVGTHSARKVYAVKMLDRYGNIDRVRRALNHGDASVTAVYAMADQLLERRLAAKMRRKTAEY